MKALVKKGPGPGADLVDMDMPNPKAGEILIEVKAGAVCGTDIHFYNWDSAASNFTVKFPLILGHEYAGDVVKIGEGVERISIGDRVSVETHVPCGRCYQCHLGQGHNCQNMDLVGITYPGAFADYAVAPEKVAFCLPQGLSYEEGSLFEPAGVAMRGIDEARIASGDLVAVIGCGPIGLIAIRMAQLCGAAQVIGIDINEFRLDMARRFGAVALNPKTDDIAKQVGKIAGRRGGADVVLEISGAPAAYEFLFDMLRPEGRVVTVGHVAEPVSIHIAKQINIKGVSLKGVFGRRIWDTWEHLLSLVEAGKLDLTEVITHRFPLGAYEEAFRQAHGDAAKIVLLP
ncbi:MAG: alcohol dehydrogenase catalytic domain-containing protein [Desulfobacterales bacterium]|jgi:threonine 3-dehydrogenase